MAQLTGKESACNARDTGDAGSIHAPGRCPGERSDNPLQYSCLENSMDGRAWQATVHEVTKSRTHLSAHACTQIVLEVKTVCCGTKQWCVT